MQELNSPLHPFEYIKQNCLGETTALFVPEGGRAATSEVGVAQLALEIRDWICKQNIKELKVVLPSGTGTTALFLQKHLREYEVLTCSCVGDDAYLRSQFKQLCADESLHPTVMKKPKKYHFGKLYDEFYEMYLTLKKQTGIEFELLYDPLAWICLQKYLKDKVSNATILYIHQGGILGNESMIERYKRKRNN